MQSLLSVLFTKESLQSVYDLVLPILQFMSSLTSQYCSECVKLPRVLYDPGHSHTTKPLTQQAVGPQH